MIRVLLILLLFLAASAPAHAGVTLRLSGGAEAVLIPAVYQSEGTLFLPLAGLLPPLGLTGSWDGAKHLYRIKSAAGEILLAPGSRRLYFGKRSQRLKQPPRFFAGELCVPEEFVTVHLPKLLGLKIDYLPQEGLGVPGDPATAEAGRDGDFPLEQIVIDAGHGGDDPGAISPDGVKEKELVLAIALRLEKILKMEGLAPVHLTRDGDYAVTLLQRSGIPRGAPDENLLISLHASAWRSSETRGCTLYLLPRREDAPRAEELNTLLAESLRSALSGSGVADCALERAVLFPLSQTPFPAILLEIGYLTNAEELRFFSSDEGQERLARALSLGLKDYAERRLRRRIDVPVTQ